ncbi:MAG: NAD-dependent epimerase/dehydratase family protein [Kiloniellaceae bacterium]
MKAFITGGCGQVGSHVAEMLLARGDQVVAIDNFATGRPEHLEKHENLTFVEGSIADKDLVDRLVGDFTPAVLIHTAASYKDPDDWYNDTLTNTVGGANLIRAAKEHAVGRFVYFQTALCYGVKPLQNPIRLDHPRDPANSSYAISKSAAEDYLTISGLDYVTFRLANVVGPRNVSGPLPIFFQRLSE